MHEKLKEGAYYHKEEDDKDYYFKCIEIRNAHHSLPDCIGAMVATKKGKPKAEIVINHLEFNYRNWKEITQKEFLSATKKYIKQATKDFT